MKEGNLMKKRITAIICLFILLSQQVSASILGTEILGWDTSDFSYGSGSGEGTLTNATSGKEITLDDEFMR